MTTDSRASVQRALDRVNAARPYERRSSMVELLTAGTALRDETEALHLWLIRAWDWLDANPTHEQWVKREARLLDEIRRYQAMHDLLGRSLVEIGRETT